MYEPVLPEREPPASPRLDSHVPGSRGPQGPCLRPLRGLGAALPSRCRRRGDSDTHVRPSSRFRGSPTVSPIRPRARAHPLRGVLWRVQPRRAQPHRQVGSQFCPVGWRISAAAPGSPRWRLGAATPGSRIPRGTDSRREAAALLLVLGRRGRSSPSPSSSSFLSAGH